MKRLRSIQCGRRASLATLIDVAGYIYDAQRACVVCRHVVAGVTVLGFAKDPGGDLHFTCGRSDHVQEDWQASTLSQLLEHIRSMKDAPVVHAGHFAERQSAGGQWTVVPFR